MKNPERVAELLAELRGLADTAAERIAVNNAAKSFSPDFVGYKVVDKNRQMFYGITYTKAQDGYYHNKGKVLHRVVWEEYHGEIPAGFVIHHVDGGKDNNHITNLRCLSRREHLKVHRKKIAKAAAKKQRKKPNNFNRKKLRA